MEWFSFLYIHSTPTLNKTTPLQNLQPQGSGAGRYKNWWYGQPADYTDLTLMLSAYSNGISYKPGVDHANADSLSCLPVSYCPMTVAVPGDVLLVFRPHLFDQSRADSRWLQTPFFPTSCILRNIFTGWSDTNPALHQYQSQATKLSAQDGCLLQGCHVEDTECSVT